MKKNSIVFVFAVVVGLFSASAQAAEKAGWVGAFGGLTVPNLGSSTARGMYGITAGAMLGDEWGIGAYYQTSSKDEDGANSSKQAFNYDLYGVEFAYHFEGEAAGVYIGGRVGTSKVKLGNTTNSPMHYGPVVGFNHMLGSSFSIGGDLSWISVASSGSSPNDISGFSTLNFLADVKFWF